MRMDVGSVALTGSIMKMVWLHNQLCDRQILEIYEINEINEIYIYECIHTYTHIHFIHFQNMPVIKKVV